MSAEARPALRTALLEWGRIGSSASVGRPRTSGCCVTCACSAGVGGGLLAAAVAFAPSFVFVRRGAGTSAGCATMGGARGFLDGAGPAAIGAILGSAVPLALALRSPWQYAVLIAATAALLALRPGVVGTLWPARRPEP